MQKSNSAACRLICEISPGLVGPSASSQSSSSAIECCSLNTRSDSRPNVSGSRSCFTLKRLTGMLLMRSSPAGSSFRHVT